MSLGEIFRNTITAGLVASVVLPGNLEPPNPQRPDLQDFCPAGEGGQKGEIIVPSAILRSGPTTESDRLASLTQGAPLTVTGTVEGGFVGEDNHWGIVITADCVKGYVFLSLVQVGEPSRTEPTALGDTPLLASGCNDVIAIRPSSSMEPINTTEILTQLFALKGTPLVWLGYPSQGEEPEWGVKHGTNLMPWSEDQIGVMEAYTSEGVEYYILFYRSVDNRYSAWVVNSRQTTDAQGNWLGNHPPPGCSPLELSEQDVEGFLDNFR